MTCRESGRKARRNSKPPVEFVRPRAYHATRDVSRSVNVPPSADVGNAHRTPRPFRQTPLRPSEGLPVASPSALKPCPADRLTGRGFAVARRVGLGPLGIADGESKKLGAPNGTAVPKTDSPVRAERARSSSRGRDEWKELAGMSHPVAPPQCLDAERRVLGSLIVFYTGEALRSVQDAGVRAEDFYYRSHEIVFRAIVALHAREDFVDSLTVTRFLLKQPHETAGTWLEAAGGDARVGELTSCASANGLVEAARIVAEDARWRRWLLATYAAQDAIHARDEDAFWRAVGGVREGSAGELRVVSDGAEKAA